MDPLLCLLTFFNSSRFFSIMASIIWKSGSWLVFPVELLRCFGTCSCLWFEDDNAIFSLIFSFAWREEDKSLGFVSSLRVESSLSFLLRGFCNSDPLLLATSLGLDGAGNVKDDGIDERLLDLRIEGLSLVERSSVPPNVLLDGIDPLRLVFFNSSRFCSIMVPIIWKSESWIISPVKLLRFFSSFGRGVSCCLLLLEDDVIFSLALCFSLRWEYTSVGFAYLRLDFCC
mmetsp:Transcript_5237/g.8247  ORF Transcript_5237/g.8247 Transcript_5237/m.8247 type:complete len:229 (-) Transcript_5237:867-1553(-)